MSCLVCSKVVPRGRKLSHLCSFTCARIRRMRLKASLKKRKETTLKSSYKFTEELAEKVTGFFNNIFGDE